MVDNHGNCKQLDKLVLVDERFVSTREHIQLGAELLRRYQTEVINTFTL
jgi:hypothetical protein